MIIRVQVYFHLWKGRWPRLHVDAFWLILKHQNEKCDTIWHELVSDQRIGESQNRWLPKTVSNDFGKLPRHQGLTWKRFKTKVRVSSKDWVAKKCGIALLLHVSFNVFLMDKNLLQTSCLCPGFPAGERTYHSFFSKGTSPPKADGGENQKETPTSTPSTTHAWDAVEDPRHHLFGISLDQAWVTSIVAVVSRLHCTSCYISQCVSHISWWNYGNRGHSPLWTNQAQLQKCCPFDAILLQQWFEYIIEFTFWFPQVNFNKFEIWFWWLFFQLNISWKQPTCWRISASPAVLPWCTGRP